MAKDKDDESTKRIKGNKRKNQEYRVDGPISELWDKPDYLEGEALKFYSETGNKLLEYGILTPLDRSAFVMLAILYGQARDCENILERDGMVISDSRGSLKKHPVIAVLNRTNELFRKLSGSVQNFSHFLFFHVVINPLVRA